MHRTGTLEKNIEPHSDKLIQWLLQLLLCHIVDLCWEVQLTKSEKTVEKQKVASFWTENHKALFLAEYIECIFVGVKGHDSFF